MTRLSGRGRQLASAGIASLLAAPLFALALPSAPALADDAPCQPAGVDAVHAKYASMGGAGGGLGPIGIPVHAFDNAGCIEVYSNGDILWSPGTGAHEIHGDIQAKRIMMPFLGYPMTDELPTPDGVGRFNAFQGGSIYWTPATGAHEVHGVIRNKWGSLGWERSFLGYPTSDELLWDGNGPGGRRSLFQHGEIRWTPALGAWVPCNLCDDNVGIPSNDG